MRSRNGNRALSLAVCSLISAALVRADHYIIGYRTASRNAQLINETLTVSRAMTPCDGRNGHSLLLFSDTPSDLHATLTQHFDDFFALIEKEGLHVRHYSQWYNAVNRDLTILRLPPRCFTVEFNEDFVSITALKK